MHKSDTPVVPSWRPFADLVVKRLIASEPDADANYWLDDFDPVGADGTPKRPDFDDWMRAKGFPHLPHDLADELRAAGADAEATLITGESQPAAHLPAVELSLAIRLASLFGNAKALHPLLQNGAITFITGLDGPEIKVAEQVLRHGLLPADLKISDTPDKLSNTTELLLLHPDTADKVVTKYKLTRYLDDIDDAIDTVVPILALMSEASDLPETLRRQGVATFLALPPLNTEVMITHLCHSHSATGRIDEPAVRVALPGDDLLAELPTTALRLALRAPTALGVATRIAAACGPRKPREAIPHLDEMAGDAPALIAARQLVADLRLWHQGSVAWSDLSRSMLLYGPPGTGKTWLARAMGNAAGIRMEEASFAAWQSAGHLGDMLREMRRSFASARSKAPCLLFIDEIDAVGSRTGDDTHGSSYRRQVINAFLHEMDVISSEAGVIVLGACNDPGAMDPAVLRAGRFDIKVQVPLPDAAMIQSILQRHLGTDIPADDLHSLATAAVGRSAAEVDAATRAARAEARHSSTSLTLHMIRHHLGIQTNPRKIALDWRVAVHECGHAIASTALRCGAVKRVLLTTLGGETHRLHTPKEGMLADLQAELSYLLAGRAAERLLLAEVSAGSGGDSTSDLALATNLALSIETKLGLGESGLMWDDTLDAAALRDPILRTRVRQHLTEAEAKALAILTAQEDLLREMSRALLHRREISGAELLGWLKQVALLGDARGDGVQVASADATDDVTCVGVRDATRDPQAIADHMASSNDAQSLTHEDMRLTRDGAHNPPPAPG
ncbi:AAA family ATPase [Pseudotabrizicola alkalilacus]|uniref:AAA family ATPase n=1 Tax=Pseudotabrizicola alkalilacus TaxID=2305252 RepID=A0A411YWC7_9RHOB|nr:AAA family ATPase [Pseudotabrizicola alkalilacus]RGP35197.1 AAA family ATPase [Pseudotabrizicola alkalilacus]